MTFDKLARFAQDRERTRLRNLDKQDGGSRLLNWTIETRQNEIAEMARKANKTSKAAELVAALNFVSVAGTKTEFPYQSHVVLNNKFAVACDGQLTAGHLITEELECCPHLGQLRAALAKTGNSLSIAELPSGQLSITGDKLAAKIPCVSFETLPSPELTKPDPICAVIDDRLKQAFATCGVTVSENGTRAFECGLLLEANICTGTDGKVLIQFWHGIDLPPALFVPKIFAAAVSKIKIPLVGFGWTEGRSITFHFENGAWIKTQLYEDKYPNIAQFMDVPCSPEPVPENLFEAIETVAAFDNDESATLADGKVIADNAEYEVEGLDGRCTYANEYAKRIAPFAKTIDLKTYDDRAFFFGDNVRGLMLGMKKLHNEPYSEQEVEPIPF